MTGRLHRRLFGTTTGAVEVHWAGYAWVRIDTITQNVRDFLKS